MVQVMEQLQMYAPTCRQDWLYLICSFSHDVYRRHTCSHHTHSVFTTVDFRFIIAELACCGFQRGSRLQMHESSVDFVLRVQLAYFVE